MARWTLKGDKRTAILEEAASTDPELRREVELLLSSDGRAGVHLRRALNSDDSTLEGGAEGAVNWRGRRVALKLVKPGMNTHEVIARFESERQLLALMDHPAIANVFDAGSTPAGAPYFGMQYLAGVPITAYCDDRKLTVRERLDSGHYFQGGQAPGRSSAFTAPASGR